MTSYDIYNLSTGSTQRFRHAFSSILPHIGRARRGRVAITVLVACMLVFGLFLKSIGDVRSAKDLISLYITMVD